jgi:hypothetical protein
VRRVGAKRRRRGATKRPGGCFALLFPATMRRAIWTLRRRFQVDFQERSARWFSKAVWLPQPCREVRRPLVAPISLDFSVPSTRAAHFRQIQRQFRGFLSKRASKAQHHRSGHDSALPSLGLNPPISRINCQDAFENARQPSGVFEFHPMPARPQTPGTSISPLHSPTSNQ